MAKISAKNNSNNMENHRFVLEKYRMGGSTKHVCPSCGRGKCFTRYIDQTTGKYVDESCGKCDHDNSCGYHYSPRQYFHDHPTAERPKAKPCKPTPPPPPKPLCTMSMDYVVRSRSHESEFMKWFAIVSPTDALKRVYDDYLIGATKDHGVIFWQIDEEQRVRSGKIMHYGADGHRKGNPSWTHASLIYNRILPDDWTLSQCFFGEHLLKDSKKTVCVVESEKSALVCSAFYPQFTWIATGGCAQLTAEKCRVLRGRKIIVYPDSGKYEEWAAKMKKTEGIDYSIVSDLEHYPGNTDIADLLIADTLPFPPIDFSAPPF